VGSVRAFGLSRDLDLSFWCTESELRYRKPVKAFGSFPKVFPESPGHTEYSMSKNLHSRLVPSPLPCSVFTRERSDFERKTSVFHWKTMGFLRVPQVKVLACGGQFLDSAFYLIAYDSYLFNRLLLRVLQVPVYNLLLHFCKNWFRTYRLDRTAHRDH